MISDRTGIDGPLGSKTPPFTTTTALSTFFAWVCGVAALLSVLAVIARGIRLPRGMRIATSRISSTLRFRSPVSQILTVAPPGRFIVRTGFVRRMLVGALQELVCTGSAEASATPGVARAARSTGISVRRIFTLVCRPEGRSPEPSANSRSAQVERDCVGDRALVLGLTAVEADQRAALLRAHQQSRGVAAVESHRGHRAETAEVV